MLHTDYSKLFSSGMRVMAQRRQRLSSLITSTVSSQSSDTVDIMPVAAGWRTKLSTKLLRRASPTQEAMGQMSVMSVQETKRARRRTAPSGFVADDLFSLRIWEKSPHAQQTSATLYEDDETVDPFGVKSYPLEASSPGPQSIFITLPKSSSMERSFLNFATTPVDSTPTWGRDRRMSVPTLPTSMQLPSHPYRMADEDEEDVPDDDFTEAWRQLRVEWITLE